MNIESAKYIAYDGNNTSVNAVIDGVQYAIPMNTDNRHYAEILKQVEAGTLTIEDAD
jgi:hypothetical protein